MNIPYQCQRCGAQVEDGKSYRAPRKTMMGRAMIEWLVCSTCRDVYAATIEKMFEGCRSSDPSKCPKCGNGFGLQGPFYAHRRPVSTEDWKVVAVCKGCFDVYCAECQQVTNGE